MSAEYKKPGFGTRLMNRTIGLVTRLGLSPQGANLLTVPGRKTGKPMSTPVNPMTLEGREYLVAPRGDTHWTRNLRAAGAAELRLGKKRRPIRVVHELEFEEKAPVLLAYLERWASVTKTHFGIPWPDPSEADVNRVCARTPMFQIEDA